MEPKPKKLEIFWPYFWVIIAALLTMLFALFADPIFAGAALIALMCAVGAMFL